MALLAKALACSAAELAEKDGADRNKTIVHKAMEAKDSVVTPDVLEALVKIDDQALTRTDKYVDRAHQPPANPKGGFVPPLRTPLVVVCLCVLP